MSRREMLFFEIGLGFLSLAFILGVGGFLLDITVMVGISYGCMMAAMGCIIIGIIISVLSEIKQQKESQK